MAEQKPKPEPLASLICQNPRCRKFVTTAQHHRGTVIVCPFCRSRLLVGATRNARTQLVGGEV